MPLVDLIKKQGGKIVGGQLVTDVTIDAAAGTGAGVYTSTKEGKKTFYAADAVIFAVGITGRFLHLNLFPLWPLPYQVNSCTRYVVHQSHGVV